MRLRVNSGDCVAHGLCGALLPECVQVDSWRYAPGGYGERPPELVDRAQRAAQGCPTLALLWESDRE